MGNVKVVETDDDSIVNFTQTKQRVDDEVDKEYKLYKKLLEKMDDLENASAYEAFKKLNPSKLNNPFFMSHVSNDIQFETASSINELSAEYGY